MSINFQPMSQEFAQDPYPTYTTLRALDEPWYYEDIDTHMLAKMSDVEAVATNTAMFRSLDEVIPEEERLANQRKMNWHDMPHHERFVQFSLLDSDGETHRRLRMLVFRQFTNQVILQQREAIQTFVDKLLDELAERSEIDFVTDFASHIPGHIIGRILGVPDKDCPQLRIWSENVVQFFNVGRTTDDKALAERATTEFYYYLQDLLAEREKRPQDDLLTKLLNHKNHGDMSGDELISTCMLILMAGHGSTIDVLGSGMHALLKFPDEHQKLRENPALITTAVQEMFRYDAPLPYFHRFATKDIEVAGKIYKAGTRFGLLYGAANRDPAHFDNPDQFDITRTPNRHIAFGKGPHLCLGNHLARLDMDVIFTTLNQRFQSIQLVDNNVEYKLGLSVRGPKSLPIAWRVK